MQRDRFTFSPVGDAVVIFPCDGWIGQSTEAIMLLKQCQMHFIMEKNT